MNAAIQVESLGKLYRIGERQPYHTLRDRLGNLLRAPIHLLRGGARSNSSKERKEIWALRDVSFEVQQGEVIGLIGRNGAGKTTLLKILSRVTTPTTGWAEIRGRVGSLLEVGTGFHPELTGRENVFLNGAILGMGRAEIERKFDEIVAFGEVADFIDTPIKHYSTGMQMRLAFAVAAHFEPEIMLVDEVLAVGDLAFQKKCLGKMGEVAQAGRTIFFVSHQMNQIRRLCQRVIWVDGGQIRADGPAGEVVGAYESAVTMASTTQRAGGTHRKAHFLAWDLIEPTGERSNVIASPGPVAVRFTVEVNEAIARAHHGIGLYDNDRRLLWGTAVRWFPLGVGVHQLVFQLPDLPVKPGAYCWRVTIWDEEDLLDSWECTPDLLVATQPVTHWLDEWAGVLNIPWEFSSSLAPTREDYEQNRA